MVRFTQLNFCCLTISFLGLQNIPLLLFFYSQGPSSFTGSLSLTSLHMLELSKPHFQALLSSLHLESPPPIQVSSIVYLRSLLQCLKNKTKSQSANPRAFIHSSQLLGSPGGSVVKDLPVNRGDARDLESTAPHSQQRTVRSDSALFLLSPQPGSH